MDKASVLELCGCCEPPVAPTPALVTNRPGLTAIAYRIGTFAAFRQTMLEAIAREPALGSLTTRRSDDPAITLLELWAAVADVLTFYQERIANEAFLRTARERDSVLRLARLLDYHLRPGIAATTRLAFTVDDGATVRIPVGLKVMSVPGQDERPQFFETVEKIVADARLNRVRVFPVPAPFSPFAQGRARATLVSGPSPLGPGDKLVFFDASRIEEKTVAALTETDMGRRLAWAPPVQATAWHPETTHAAKYSCVFRFFGYNAPKSYQKFAPAEFTTPKSFQKFEAADLTTPQGFQKFEAADLTTPQEFQQIAPAAFTAPYDRWVTVTDTDPEYSFALSHEGASFSLDARYGELKPGTLLLVDTATGSEPIRMVTVTEVGQRPATLGPLQDTVTQVTVNQVLEVADRRRARIYQLEAPELAFRPYGYADKITGSRVAVPLDRLDRIDKGRAILLTDARSAPSLAVVTGTHLLYVESVDAPDHLAIDFEPEIPNALETTSAVLLGNVVEATHGETVRDEILGDGDAATPFQRVALRKKPLTYVPSARSARGESTLRVLINGEKWAEVKSLYAQPPTAPVYTARQADDGTTSLQFGDGVTGARLPSGRGNLIATYRQGVGLEGRVKADQLSILLERPVGLKSVTNPAAAEGGADPESLDKARETAPTTVKTFGRAVSLVDFESLATASGEVARAKATWVWRGLEKAVHLTIAGQKGAPFSAEALKRLHSGLTQQRDPNHTLLLANVCRVPVVVAAKLRVDDRYVRDDVKAAARQALVDFFAFERMGFAHPIHLSDIYRVLQDVTGVASVDIDTLHFKGYAAWTAEELAARGATAEPAQGHLRIFAARARPGPASVVDPAAKACFGTGPLPEVLPAEQAFIESEPADITLTATGGLE